MAQHHVPDLIICDIAMPTLSGYEVLTEVRHMAETAATPFIFLTARSEKSFMRHGMELGADDYLTKPFTAPELLAAVSARLERHEFLAKDALQNLEQAKKVFIQMVSHELRTPLSSISMVTDIISREIGQLSTIQMQELVDTLERGAERLGRLVEQIVLVVQLETEALSPQMIQKLSAPMHLSEILIAAGEMARRFAYRQPDVVIRLDKRDSEVLILGDMRALKHALAEVITNALSFSPAGSEIVVSQWEASGQAWVSITDQGPGMSPEQVEGALQDFHQIDREKREQQGAGLGLPLARRIIEVHGGAFELSSVAGKGTQVVISLPVAE